MLIARHALEVKVHAPRPLGHHVHQRTSDEPGTTGVTWQAVIGSLGMNAGRGLHRNHLTQPRPAAGTNMAHGRQVRSRQWHEDTVIGQALTPSETRKTERLGEIR